ncbi:hypothetical protein C1752_01718 [Acaryochloris thomasi RCC1774]|uniref:Uncharacterized protein n=1 Tax=Acaryochloris thomasi RCC1774 TaxID=1764569 RepID=A0A2W1JL05_9CYAN|nr:hypothetical protein C1752_01718 [Acaryochloris thomasi RCC1774]
MGQGDREIEVAKGLKVFTGNGEIISTESKLQIECWLLDLSKENPFLRIAFWIRLSRGQWFKTLTFVT